MEVKKNVVDVSSFFFFEATGDSEADHFNDPNVAAIDHNRPDDDAESCSCDLSGGYFPSVTDDHVNGCDSRSCVDDEEEEGEEEGEEAHSYSRWSCEKKKKKKKKKEKEKKKKQVERDKKSSVSVDSAEEIMSEKEKSRLFWETCLAS
ncbi:hypothetical protein ACOSP7_001635 [Xanthoceras sorbifolium]